MGKFEKRIRKKVKSEVDDFNAWYGKNKDKLSRQKVEELEHGEVIALKKKRYALLLALGAILVGIIIFLSILLTQRRMPERIDFIYFADGELITGEATIDDEQNLKEEFAFLNQMTNVSGTVTRHIESNAIVFVQLSSEVEFSDYYLCDFKIVIDERYHFFAEERYFDLPNSVTIQNGIISYKEEGVSDIGLIQYTLVVNTSNMKAYLDLQCFEGHVMEFIEQCFDISEANT